MKNQKSRQCLTDSCPPASNRDEWLKGRIYTALAHHYIAGIDQKVFNAIMRDWLECLQNYSQDKIAAAFIEHMKLSDKKPTICGIVRLCDGHPLFGEKPPEKLYERLSREHARDQLAKQRGDC